MRKCDFCAQEIQDEAVFCRHCHRDLPRNERLAGKKRCAHCAEWIERGTIVCPYCTHDLVPSTGMSRVYRPDRPDAAPRSWDPRDVLRGGAVPPFTSGGEPEGERRSVLGRLGISRREEKPPEPPPVPIQASPPPEEPASGPRPGLIRRLMTPPQAGTDASRPRPSQPRQIAWGAEPRPPDGPLSPRLFATPPEPAAERPRVRHRVPWGRLTALFLLGGLFVVALAAVRGGWLEGLSLESLLRAFAAPSATSATATLTGSAQATAPLLPGPSPTSPPTSAANGPTGTPDPAADCVSWDEVTVANEGQTLCVFGEVAGRYVTEEFPIVVYFSSEPGAFIIVDRLTPHPEVDPGVCVMVIGEVEVMSRVRPVIDAQGEILFCQ